MDNEKLSNINKTSEIIKATEISEDEDSDNSGKLKISLTPPQKRKRKRTISVNSTENDKEELLVEKPLDEKRIREFAKRNNLSPDEIKQILRKLVRNDHILALVHIQEEEELKEETTKNDSSTTNIVKDKPNGNGNEMCVPTLTRAKAKQLNKRPIQIPALNEITPEPEIAALISQELHSDEEDEDYEPREDDFASDDDPNTTSSDIDSQPRTPMTTNSLHGDFEDQPTEYSQDGLFKVPRQRKDSVLSQHEEIIAKRTRSKVCMQTIPIEHLESSLVPPDISIDMYDCDIDIDPSWKEFLDDFQKPLPLQTNMEDDEGDPEYVAADQERIDSEELRNVDISQKEIFDLFDGLLEGFDMNNWLSDDFTQIEMPKRTPEETPLKKRKINSENMQITAINETLTNLTSNVSVISTPPANYQTNQIINNNVMPISCNTMFQQPAQMQTSNPVSSTPVPYFPTTTVPYHTPNLTLPANQGIFCQTVNLTGPVATISYQLPISQDGSNQVLAYMPQIGTGHYAPVMVSQPPVTPKPQKKKRHKPYDSSNPYDYGRVQKYFSSRKYVNKKYKKKYEALKSAPVIENNFEENQVGFTYLQRSILEEQMRMHVQFAAQNFFQTYCHPELWKYAQKEKDMLVQLEKLGQSDEKSMFNAWNLKPALELMKRWEDELSIDNSENRALMDFYYNEIDRLRNRKKTSYAYLPKFPPRMMKYVVTSPVFIYPHLLPYIPFRVDIAGCLGLEPVEEQLMAFGMENYYKEREMLEKKHKPRKPRKIGLYRTCEHIKKYYLFTNSKVNTIYQHIKKRQSEEGYNPIKYFFEHKKAPPVQHSLIKIDLENILPPKDRINELPAVWKEFALMLKAIEIETSKQPRNFAKSLKEVYKSIYSHEQPSHNKSQDNANVVININYVLDKKEVAETLNQSNSIREMFYDSLNGSNSAKDHVQSNRTNFEKSSENDFDFTSICTRIYNQPDSSNGSNNYKLYKTGNNYFSSPSSRLSMSSWDRPDTPISTLSRTPKSCTDLINTNSKIIEIPVGQKLLTDYYSFVDRTAIQSNTQIEEEKDIQNNYETELKSKQKYWKKLQLRYRRIPRYGGRRKFISKRLRKITKNNQRNKILKKKLQNLLVFYRSHFYASCERYKNEILKSVFIHFKTLDLYTNLLKLRTDIENMENLDENISINGSDTSFMSQTKCSLDSLMEPFVTETKENYRKRDAIYALNFYEKIQEIFKNSKKQKEFIKFQKILRCFKPHSDRVASLYYKIENLFLPDNPELAEIFLTFLLPSEASKIGTFFKKFMLNNINNNLKKVLLDFLNNHSGKLKDIYKCLNDLSEEQNVTIDKLKNELLPLIHEDRILIEWFLEAFPSNDKENNSWQNNKKTVSSPESKLNTQKVNNEMNISNPKIVLPARLAILAKTLFATSGEYSNQTTNEENQAERITPKKSITTDCELTNIEQTETDSFICQPSQIASSCEKTSNQPSINSTDFINIKETYNQSHEKTSATLSQSFGSDIAIPSLSNSSNILATHNPNGKNQLLEQSNTGNSSSVSSESITEIKSPTWTREEDKLILEEVQLNLGTEESLFLKLINLLPLRCKEEIVERYHFLMDVLIRLQGKT